MTEIVDLGDGRKASYQVVPGGPTPLLWFEGGPGLNARLGRPDVMLLADRATGYLIDAPGAGASTPPTDEAGYGVGETAAFYDEVRRRIGLERVAVSGHSWGATVALVYASRFPEVTTRCVAVSPFAGVAVDETSLAQEEQRVAIDRHRNRPWFAKAFSAWNTFGDPAVDDPALARERWRPAWPLYFVDPSAPGSRHHIRRLRREFTLDPRAAQAAVRWAYDAVNLDRFLPAIECPTLVLAGDLDIVCGPAHARAVVRGVRDGRLHVFGGCGHLPQYEAPQDFRQVVFDWWT